MMESILLIFKPVIHSVLFCKMAMPLIDMSSCLRFLRFNQLVFAPRCFLLNPYFTFMMFSPINVKKA